MEYWKKLQVHIHSWVSNISSFTASRLRENVSVEEKKKQNAAFIQKATSEHQNVINVYQSKIIDPLRYQVFANSNT